MVQHALAEFGQHVLQHGRPGPDEEHPIVTEIAPDKGLRPQRQGIDLLGLLHELRHEKQCYRFRTLYQQLDGVMPIAHGLSCGHILDSLYCRIPEERR